MSLEKCLPPIPDIISDFPVFEMSKIVSTVVSFDRCAPGYHGNPNEELGRCEMCQCSDNIDMTDRGSCSENTGACLICDNNSTGANCSQCRDWWHGDAVTAKDCQRESAKYLFAFCRLASPLSESKDLVSI